MDYASVLKQKKYFAERENPLVFDNLTGVLSRDSFFEYMNFLISEKRKFSFLELDIDNFKYINDNFGHLVGDKVLIEVIERVVDYVKNSAVVGRFGGDEFLMVIEDCSEYDQIWEFAHKLQNQIEGFVPNALNNISITMTCGIARFPIDADNLETLFETADKALYRGKTKGRNCFIIYLESKHKNIDLKSRDDVKISTAYIFQQIFAFLNRSGNYAENLKALFTFLANQFMFDHICIQSKKAINVQVVSALSKTKEYKVIDPAIFFPYMSGGGLFVINNVDSFKSVSPELYELDSEQKIRGQLVVRISSGDQFFGILRTEMTQKGRIWQADEIAMLIMVANFIAKDLHYKGITLDDL